MKRMRKSVPTAGMHRWWLVGWSYVMPDFDNKDHSIIEWLGIGTPAEPDDEHAIDLAAQVSELVRTL